MSTAKLQNSSRVGAELGISIVLQHLETLVICTGVDPGFSFLRCQQVSIVIMTSQMNPFKAKADLHNAFQRTIVG